MQVRLKGYTISAKWEPGSVKDIDTLRKALWALPTSPSVLSGAVDTTSLDVIFLDSDLTPETLVNMVEDTIREHKIRFARHPNTLHIIQTARSNLRAVAEIPGACRCNPPFSGEEHCNGGCEARAMLMGVELLNAIEALIATGACDVCYEHFCDVVSCDCLCHKFADGAMNGAGAVFDKASGQQEIERC